MYNVNYNNIQFNVLDYTGTKSLSTYTLDITPLYFIPDFTTSTLLSSAASISNNLIHWDFGDGSFSTGLTASHSYQWPGSYNATLTIFDGNGNAYDSSYNPTINVYDFIPTSLTWQNYYPLSAQTLSAKIMGPFTVNSFNSWQSYPALSATGYTINFYASGAGGDYITATDYYNNKWSHLRVLNNFLALEEEANSLQYVIVDSLSTIQTVVYANIQNNKLQICGPNDPGATVAGTTGYCTVYYTDDSVKDILADTPIYLFATIDSSKYSDYFTQRTDLYNYVPYPMIGYQNLKPAVISIIRDSSFYTPATALDISTNGITGEGTLANSISSIFNIPTICWQGTQIPYVITLKDINNFTTKFYPPLSSSIANLNISTYTQLSALTAFNLQTGIIYYDQNGNINSLPGVTFTEDFVTPGAVQQLGSFYKGYFTSNSTALSCALTASMVVVDPYSLSINNPTTALLVGQSNTFNIYTTAGQYNFTKINENWDASGFYKSLRFQEPLLDYDNFFTNFLGTIVGDINAYPYELGKTVYEKISNFVSNKSDIDISNVDVLLSLCDELSIQFEQYNYNYPPQLRRVIDMLSVKLQKLNGNPNTYNTNFNNNTQLYTDRSIGPNLGSLINPLTGVVFASTPIVAYEIFSGNYTLVNNISSNYISLTSSQYGSQQYAPLSAYSPNWGWNLIAPNSITGTAITNYYKFYNYNNSLANNIYTTDGTLYDGLINWLDPLTNFSTTITGSNTYPVIPESLPNNSYSNWSNDNGIMQNIISYELTKGLGLFTSAVQIALT